MKNTRKLFFQILLIILALIFILCVRFAYENQNAPAGTFGEPEKDNVTISQIFSEAFPGGENAVR